tara:strand:+ start:952 stop:1398 length:447 start_codon:yes stop_codon:yes gene_type:complete
MAHNVRFTVKCPKLAQHKAKGITPDELKTMDKDKIKSQTKINELYNKRAIELGDILISKLTDVDITWCNDGCAVISCSNTLKQVENIIDKEGLEIEIDRSEIAHKCKNVSSGLLKEDINEVYEPKTLGEKKLLKSKIVKNQYQLEQKI